MNIKTKNERIKLILVGLLGLGLLGAVLWSPTSNKETIKLATTPVASSSAVDVNNTSSSSTTPPFSSHILQLDCIAVEQIAAIDPFARWETKTPTVAAESQTDEEKILADESVARAVSQYASLSATYSGRRGAVALIGNDVLHVGEPLIDNRQVIEIGGGTIRISASGNPVGP